MGLRPFLWVACTAASRGPAEIEQRSIADRRSPIADRRAAERSPQPPTDDGLLVRDHDVAVGGATITVRSYRPDRPGRLPAHLYGHGGAYWSGSIQQTDSTARLYAATVQCAVLSIGYRLAPENPWPVPAEDYYAVLQWVASNADELSIDSRRISVGGVSCGAGLATVAAMRARDRGGPDVMYQLLEIPTTDLTMSQTSMRTFATGYIVTSQALAEGYSMYVPDGVDRAHPYISPLLADDLSGLPPATVLTCEFDPLRDEGVAYARRLNGAGVPTQTIFAKGHIHGSTYSASPFLPSARRYQRMAADALRRAYEGAAASPPSP